MKRLPPYLTKYKINRRHILYIAISLSIIFFIYAATAGRSYVMSVPAHMSFYYQVEQCDKNNQLHTPKVNCWLSLLGRELKQQGVSTTIKDLVYVVNKYSVTFNAGDCHTASHDIGDMIYFDIYLNDGNFQNINFPPESSFCTFGILHGFFMHLVQDHPTNEFITQTCDYFYARFSKSIPTIKQQCYHGAGHGFVLAQSAGNGVTFGDPKSFIITPLKECDALPGITSSELLECRQGAFTQLVSWTTARQYGLSFDTSNPFSLCNSLPGAWQAMCYDQFADSYFGMQTTLTMPELVKDTSSIASTSLRAIAFKQAMMSMVQRAIPDNSYTLLIGKCGTVPADLFKTCIQSFPNAIFNAGLFKKELDTAIALCNLPSVASLNAQTLCYQGTIEQLKRYQSTDNRTPLCMKIPPGYRSECLKS